ncbi:triose-phosphate transporter family-domain-containing protein [Dichotomopilus funicola]|uniref:Triose-phosphate transporter family-domain-containing protein n=1 Tax=Dichotomopilus funicola TaxID=1934379 RepID=A0AAN6ZMN0_9PEZI|nr:triose-phosphate transporter family-domain-containing protein [Dichotomopilus funicola]
MPHATSHSTSHSASASSHMRAPSQTRSSSITKSYGDSPNGVGSSGPGETEKFPDFDAGHTAFPSSSQPASTPRWQQNGFNSGSNGDAANAGRWTARRDSRVRWAPRESVVGPSGHAKKSSISQTVHRMRSSSMSQNAHEIAGALRAPVSWKLIGLCLMWYWSSAMTNTSSKTILTAFDKPATLTLIQFAFVSSYCLLFSWLASTFPRLRAAVPALRHPIRAPSRDVIRTTLPLAAFSIGGHLLSSNATSKIPVSLVHTIKGLSPLFTVFAYRIFFDIRYPRATYFSLVPLTIGVMLACSGNHAFSGGQFLGIMYALFAAIIFVTQNIFSKRLFNEAARVEQEGAGHQSRKLDKLNLLCYSSGLAFLLTCPIWAWSEGIGILGDFLWDGSVDLNLSPNSLDHGPLVLEYIFNGTFHFGQNIFAFVLLSMVSPVTYSVASLIKRVFVIIIAILWFRSPTTGIQAVGIALTFLGLYLYDRSSERNKADQRARSLTETRRQATLLPLNTKHSPPIAATTLPPVVPIGFLNGSSSSSSGAAAPTIFESPSGIGPAGSAPHTYTQGSAAAAAFASGGPAILGDTKKSDDVGIGSGSASNGGAGGGPGGPAGSRNRGMSNAAAAAPAWRPPGTRQEDTWRTGDSQTVVAQ